MKLLGRRSSTCDQPYTAIINDGVYFRCTLPARHDPPDQHEHSSERGSIRWRDLPGGSAASMNIRT
jgi:hypothetical protein